MRIVAIESKCGQDNGEYKFNEKEMKDSEAFHLLLTNVDPGEEYNVFFYNLEEAE